MKKSNALAALERLRSMDSGEALAVLERYQVRPDKVWRGRVEPTEQERIAIRWTTKRRRTPEEQLARSVARLTKALEQAGEQLQPPAAVAEAQAAVVEAAAASEAKPPRAKRKPGPPHYSPLMLEKLREQPTKYLEYTLAEWVEEFDGVPSAATISRTEAWRLDIPRYRSEWAAILEGKADEVDFSDLHRTAK